MNTQKEFLQTLEEELKYLKAQETNEILKHYRDKINTELDYGTSEDKIIKNLPLPKDIAKEIYDSRGISYLEIQKKKYRQKEIGKAIISALIILTKLLSLKTSDANHNSAVLISNKYNALSPSICVTIYISSPTSITSPFFTFLNVLTSHCLKSCT